MRIEGKVIWYNAKKGYGFIRPEDANADDGIKKDVFVHFSKILGDDIMQTLTEGEPVTFLTEPTKYDFMSAYDVVRMSISQEDSRNYEKVFENTDDIQTIAPVVLVANEELKRYFAKHPEKLYDLSPRKFEELIADILTDFGFGVNLTPETRDGGRDIIAYLKNQICSFLMFVECKKWSPSRHVGIEVVQRLYGVQQGNQANKSMIVTTSFFTKPAIEARNRYETMMTLHDYNDLKVWLQKYR
jgi:cold shock CspA family protein